MAASLAFLATTTTMIFAFFLLLFASQIAGGESSLNFSGNHNDCGPSASVTLCSKLLQPAGYPCAEHTVQTDDGYLLAVQRVSSKNGNLRQIPGPPVLLLHGLFMAGEAWFLNSPEESLGFILADDGFDVWVASVRGTRWSCGHVSLSVKDKDFWDWSWQDLALHDVVAMVRYVNSVTNSKVFLVGHSQGTLISLGALIQGGIADRVEAAGLLSPIAYLGHTKSELILAFVNIHVDQLILGMGIHQLNLRSAWFNNLLESLCAANVDCNHLVSSITGKNCCFNNSRVDFYLEYEPHPSSTKNLNHFFQLVRSGTFSKYDYGIFKNLLQYGQLKPPEFDLGDIPESVALWMAYGGNDAIAGPTDVRHAIKKLKSTPVELYLENYGHVDFIVSVNGKADLYDPMINFFKSRAKSSSFK